MACTLFPEGNWGHCCGAHDENYKADSKYSRKVADQKLRLCVENRGHPNIAKAMYAGVRAFGWLFYKGKK